MPPEAGGAPGSGARLRPGGCVLYAGRVYLAHGIEPVGHPALDILDDSVPEPIEALTFRNRYDTSGRREQLVSGAVPVLLPQGALAPVDVLHLAPVFGEVPLAPWLDAAPARIRGAGLQGWTRGRRGARVVPAERLPPLEQLGRLDVLFASEEDLEGHAGLLDALRALGRGLVVTRGPRGALVYERGGAARVVAAAPVAALVDPTGAGDSFAAGTLLMLALDADLERAARYGARAGAVCVQHEALPPPGAYELMIDPALRRSGGR